jgi:hypothetical protein
MDKIVIGQGVVNLDDLKWSVVDGVAIYNKYHRFDVKEFETLLEIYNFNATKVKKHYFSKGRKIPVEIVYSLRRFLGLPKFKFPPNSCYSLDS